VRNARALSAVRIARTRISLPRGRTQPQAPVWEGHSLRPCCSVGYLEVPAGEWWNENGNGTAGTSLKSSPAWYVRTKHPAPAPSLALFPPSTCVCDAAWQQQQHLETFSLLSRLACRWSHGNVSKEWQSTLSAVEGRHAKRL
jgi:hypothetical protein